jgi:hypothetical protein
MRKSLSGTTEDFCEPPDSLLMRYVEEVAVAKCIGQAVWTGIRLCQWLLFRRPKVPPPGRKGQGDENRDGSCDKNCCQKLSSPAREFVKS